MIINCTINQIKDFSRTETEKLRKDLKKIGVDKYIEVDNVPQLLSTLEAYHGQPICLFTNLSPNLFFVKNGINVNEFKVEPIPNWRVEQYSFSATLYHHICKEYPIIAVHFITSALKRNINDCDFLNITDGVKTTIQRKQDWMKPGMNYEVNLKGYMFDKIREAKKSVSAKNMNGEFSLNNPLLQFFQN